MDASTTIPTTFEIRREHLIGLIVAAVDVAAVITWLLVAVAFDSSGGQTQQPSALTPADTQAIQFPPDYRGMP